MAFLNRGEDVLNRVIAECGELGKCEDSPKMEGRYMRILVTPTPQASAKAGAKGAAEAKKPSPESTEAAEA